MRYLLLVAAALALCPLLHADEGFERSFSAERNLRAVNLFEQQAETRTVAFAGDFDLDPLLRAPIMESPRESADQMFGTGATLGINSAALGVTFGGFFDFYFTPWLAAGAHFSISYGILGRPEHNGGDALAVAVLLGAKFVLDFEDVEITDWFRPFVALYPAGFAYFAATEDADVPGTGDTKDVKYSDIFYLIAGGAGIDFYLTNLIGVGFGLYLYGTVGGSKHEHSNNIETKTKGAVGVYFEYARLSLRF